MRLFGSIKGSVRNDFFLSSLVARFAREKIQPHVRQMDETSNMDKSVISGLFQQGVRRSVCE